MHLQDSERSFSDTETFGLAFHAKIPAADNAGSAGGEAIREVLDFSDHMTEGDVFEAVSVETHAHAWGPSTATAEGQIWFEYLIGQELNDDVGSNAVFDGGVFNASQDDSEDKLDLGLSQSRAQTVVKSGQLKAEASFNDTTAGTGGGSWIGYESDMQNFEEKYGFRPRFEWDEELNGRVDLGSEGTDDHAVEGTLVVQLHGTIHED